MPIKKKKGRIVAECHQQQVEKTQKNISSSREMQEKEISRAVLKKELKEGTQYYIKNKNDKSFVQKYILSFQL